MFKPIAIRFNDKPIVLLVNKKKYDDIKNSLRNGREFHFYMTKKEIDATREFGDKTGGSILGTIASIGIPLLGDLFGKLFNKGGRIYLGNEGGRINLGGSKSIPNFSAYIKKKGGEVEFSADSQ